MGTSDIYEQLGVLGDEDFFFLRKGVAPVVCLPSREGHTSKSIQAAQTGLDALTKNGRCVRKGVWT